MKRLPVFILVAIITMMAVVTGCGRSQRYDGRLVAADSLMQSDPDSALALVEGVCRDSLSSEGDRAYRDLLLTQARYRCYVTATSDSTINSALTYYRSHQGEREKLTRAYIYKGTVLDELGLPDSAMHYYKQAETVADTADYFNLGYINLRIAELYQSLYTNDFAAFFRMKKATGYFTVINDTSYLIVTVGGQGALLFDTDPESARSYLEKAIALGDATNSTKRFNYQSKLAGIYFYKKKDYAKAKDLAMDIIRHGADECDEYQFYYYAARSFIRLNDLDSARYVESIIPSPLTSLDSMNHYRFKAEMAQAEHRYHDYTNNLAKSKDISDRLFNKAIKNNVREEELKIETDWKQSQLQADILFKFLLAIGAVIFLLAISIFIVRRKINNKIASYESEINCSRQELEQTIDSYEKRIEKLELKHGNIIFEKENELEELNKENVALLSKHQALNQTMHQQVLAIVRDRKSLLNELYQAIRVKSYSGKSTKRHPLPLVGLIKELNDQKKLLNITPSDLFWEKLKQSIDCELNGIATFVEKNYPSIEEQEFKLFLLLCADVSPQIIKLCLGYDHVVTVSNYKTRLVKKTFGMDGKFDEFIQKYLEGKLCDETSTKKG